MEFIKKTLLIAFILSLTTSVTFSQNEINIKVNDNIIHLKTFSNGEPILIINGGPGMNSDGFAYLAEQLGKANKAIIYDQRGTGKSKMRAISSETIKMDLMVEDIETIRKHLKINDWVVLGHSFGGMLASYYTSKFPTRVKGLILSSSGGIDMELFSTLDILSKLSDVQRDSLNYWNKRIEKGDTSYVARFKRGTNLAPAYLYDKSHINTIAHRLTQTNYKINNLVFQNMRKINFDCKEGLKRYIKPVLIIQGKQDIISEKIALKAHKVFQNSKMVLLEKCGHYGWLDQPKLYFTEIDEFLNSSQIN